MSLRDSLKGTVARCTPQGMQHATTAPGHATAHATAAQQPGRLPRQNHATDDATTAQQRSCTGVALGALAGQRSCTDLAAALAAAINRACTLRGDTEANRAGLLAECAALPPEGQADMLAHFTLEAARWGGAHAN
jgi:hypothetical protein